jgi:hypothetical protein
VTGGPTVAVALEGPAPEQALVRDMARRALPAVPVVVAVAALAWGWAGALSALYAVVLVLANFVVAAALLAWTARISLSLMMGAALFGYLVRLALITAAVVLVRDAGWVELVPLGLTLVSFHLGLLFWETRYVSASLAFPALKPGKR